MPLTQSLYLWKKKKLLPDWRALNSILIYPPEWLCNFLKHSVQSPVWKSEVGLSFKSFDTSVWSTFSLNEKTHTENVTQIHAESPPKNPKDESYSVTNLKEVKCYLSWNSQKKKGRQCFAFLTNCSHSDSSSISEN